MKKLSAFCVFLSISLSLARVGSAQSITPGTEIHVQLLDQLDTGKTRVGQEFAATLAEPIQLESGAVWPKGTEIQGKVVDVVSSGRLSRPASITLQLTQIGNSPLETETERIDRESHAGRNAAIIGGGSALGAVLGGIAGGGKGAVIGAAAGAGAGTVTAAATGKQEIVLRAETSLTFVAADNAPAEPVVSGQVPESDEPVQAQVQQQDSGYYTPYAPEQLDNLLAPIALYPDPLLAQVLLAATFPDQIQDAAHWVRFNNPNEIDYQPWDVSVKAVAHYSTVLAMLNERLDWTTALGQAYVYQSTDMMASVQRLRNLAYSQGNLVATPEQQVILERGYIQIVPAQPRLIFVPVYDPRVIYVQRVYRPGFGFNDFFGFGTGFAIGAWLNHDLDWGSNRVVYDGWNARSHGWRERSRPYVNITNVYVNNRYEQVNVNRNVVVRNVDYDNIKGYNSVHRDVTFENRARIESRNESFHASQPPQTPNERVNGREDRRGNQFGAHRQPSVQTQPQPPQGSSNTGLEHTNQAASKVEQSRPQPPNERMDGREDRRGNQFGAHRQPSVQTQPQQPQGSSNTGLEHTNQAASNVEPSRPQPPNKRMNAREDGARNQPSAGPEKTTRILPQPSAQGAPSAATATRTSTENHPGAHQQGQQQQQRHEEGARSKGKDNGEGKN